MQANERANRLICGVCGEGFIRALTCMDVPFAYCYTSSSINFDEVFVVFLDHRNHILLGILVCRMSIGPVAMAACRQMLSFVLLVYSFVI